MPDPLLPAYVSRHTAHLLSGRSVRAVREAMRSGVLAGAGSAVLTRSLEDWVGFPITPTAFLAAQREQDQHREFDRNRKSNPGPERRGGDGYAA